jgi:hypothetical protein
MARLRWLSSVNIPVMRASTDGTSAAPATPSRARLAISISGPVENAAATEAVPNAAPPMSKSLLRPIRSPTVPKVTRDPASMNP